MPKLLGHIIKEHEAIQLSREYSMNLLQAIATYLPVRIVGQEDVGVNEENKMFLKKNNQAFFTVTVDPLTVSRVQRLDDLKKHMNDSCVSVLQCLLKAWDFETNPYNVVYMFNQSCAAVIIKDNEITIDVQLHVSGRPDLENDLSEARKKEMSLVQQSESVSEGSVDGPITVSMQQL